MQIAPFLTVPMPVTACPSTAAGQGVAVHAELIPHALPFHAVSAAARDLAERVGTRLVGGPLRVACLLPSGRPVVMPIAGAKSCMVSIAHSRRLIAAAACRGVGGVGIDIVPADDPSAAIDWCFEAAEAAAAGSRARLWAAKEAAYKASRIDAGFQPRRVRIAPAGAARFRWSIDTEFGIVGGVGGWTEAGGHVVAVAVQPATGRSISTDGIHVHWQEATRCS